MIMTDSCRTVHFVHRKEMVTKIQKKFSHDLHSWKWADIGLVLEDKLRYTFHFLPTDCLLAVCYCWSIIVFLDFWKICNVLYKLTHFGIKNIVKKYFNLTKRCQVCIVLWSLYLLPTFKACMAQHVLTQISLHKISLQQLWRYQIINFKYFWSLIYHNQTTFSTAVTPCKF